MRTTSHTVTRRRLLTTGLATGLALTVPGVAGAVPYDPENDDPDFHPVKFRLPTPSGRKALGTTAIHLVEFPCGRFLPGVPASQLPDPDFTRQAVETRTADARFVLDQLERIAGGENPDAEGNDLPDGVGAGLDLRKLGMFGFSLGGYATANTMLADERVTAGVDLDGTLQDDPVKGPLGEVARTGLGRPFLLRGDCPKFPEIRFAR